MAFHVLVTAQSQRRQEMASIRKRNGKYQVQIRIKKRRPVSKTFLTQNDAQRWAREVERQISLGNEVIKPFEGSFSDLLDRYEHSIVPFLKGQPQEISLIRRIRSRLGKLSVREIDAPFLSEYRDRRLSVVSAQTAKHEINCVRRVLKLAQTEWNIYLPNGIPSVRPPKIPRGRTQGKAIGTPLARADNFSLLLNASVIFRNESKRSPNTK